jgi:phage terminase large subunit
MARPEVDFKLTNVFNRLASVAEKRIVCLYGGSSSSKTISALQYLTMIGTLSEKPLVLSVVGESIPVIKRSVLRDWQNVVMGSGLDPKRFNKVDFTYTFPMGSILQFIPADDPARFFAMRHDYVLIDEAYNVRKDIFDQIEIRTRRQILLTWNPVAPFWGTKLEDERSDVAVIHAVYRDNPFVEQSIIDALEIRAKTDPNFYRVFVLGEYGSLEGLIFKELTNWQKCERLPEEHKRRILCVDFGFTNDPSAIEELIYSDGQFFVDEIEYKPGMLNREIADIINGTTINKDGKEVRRFPERIEVVCDSAEPKSIAELRTYGINAIPAIKGPDSVKFGLKTMQGFKMNITKDSINVIKEFRNYSYAKNRHGEFTGDPVDNWNHAIDGIRYGITHIRKNPNFGRYAVS